MHSADTPVPEILDQLTNEFVSARLIDAGSEESASIPAAWQPVLDAGDPDKRARIALSLWNQAFLDMLPRFARVFPARLQDVRVFWLRTALDAPRGRFVLVYLTGRDDENRLILWIGWDPASFGEHEPDYFETIPEPVRDFLRQTHAGFTGEDFESDGLRSPSQMVTLAQAAGVPEGEPGWEIGYGDVRIDSTRLLWTAWNGSQMYYCTSPDLPADTITVLYEGDLDPPTGFGIALDDLLIRRLGGA